MKLDGYRIRNIRRNGKASAYEITQLADTALHFLEKQHPADILDNQVIAESKALGSKAIKLPGISELIEISDCLPNVKEVTLWNAAISKCADSLKQQGFTLEGDQVNGVIPLAAPAPGGE